MRGWVRVVTAGEVTVVGADDRVWLALLDVPIFRSVDVSMNECLSSKRTFCPIALQFVSMFSTRETGMYETYQCMDRRRWQGPNRRSPQEF